MTCSCCLTGRCCNGATCTSKNNSECAYNSGTFSEGGDCSSFTCIALSGRSPCTLTNACNCAASGKTTYFTQSTCDCNTLLASIGVDGGCQWYYCNSCSATGTCVYDCPSPRTCCAGTCCPELTVCCNGNCCTESQYCLGGTSPRCAEKCGTGLTYCRGTGTAYSCCAAGQKCCGASGCLSPVVSQAFTVNVAVPDWVNTGVTVPSGASVSISASGTVQWSGAGSTATPNGVTSGACNCCDGASVTASFCHMALIGRIGASGTPFLVGSSYSGTPGAGQLYLRQNDTVVGDNSGSFTGSITTDPCPGYTPASVGEPIVFGSGEKPVEAPPGPGTELKGLLKLVGIVASATCSCNARAAQMDAWGEWECLKRLPEITGWLKEEAEKREMWFFPPAGMALILASISLAALKRPFRGNNR